MIPAAVLLACPNLAVPARLMYHVAMVESDANQYAIGVVGGRLLRQPASLGEAIATARSLETQGYNFSVGVAQVNHANLEKYGLDTYEKAFSICGNLLVGSRILAQCYVDAGGVWGKAFSCYYSGDFSTGFRDGYVQRVLTSLGQGGAIEHIDDASGAAPIPVLPVVAASQHASRTSVLPGSAAYRVAIRTSLLDAAASAVVSRVASKISRHDPADALETAVSTGSASMPSAQDVTSSVPIMSAGMQANAAAPTAAAVAQTAAAASVAPAAKVFVPQVVDLKHPAQPTSAADGQMVSTAAPPAAPPEDSSDAAFVF